jgi:hypothetical protein
MLNRLRGHPHESYFICRSDLIHPPASSLHGATLRSHELTLRVQFAGRPSSADISGQPRRTTADASPSARRSGREDPHSVEPAHRRDRDEGDHRQPHGVALVHARRNPSVCSLRWMRPCAAAVAFDRDAFSLEVGDAGSGGRHLRPRPVPSAAQRAGSLRDPEHMGTLERSPRVNEFYEMRVTIKNTWQTENLPTTR